MIVLSHGGFLRIGEKETAVLFSALRYDQTDKRLLLDIGKEKLAGAPTFICPICTIRNKLRTSTGILVYSLIGLKGEKSSRG